MGYHKTYVSFVIRIHVTTYSESLVKIGRVVFLDIWRNMPIFAVLYKKVQLLGYPSNLWGYWTDLDHICTRCSYNIVIEHF